MKEEEIIALAPKAGLSKDEVESIFFKTSIHKKLYNTLDDLENTLTLSYGLRDGEANSLIILATLKVLEDCTDRIKLERSTSGNGKLALHKENRSIEMDLSEIEILPKGQIENALQIQLIKKLRNE